MPTETTPTDESSDKIMLPSSVYDFLKPFVQVILPGLGTLYFALAGIWGLPAAEEVIGTIAAVTVFLGLILNISSRRYNSSEAKYDGAVQVTRDDTGSKKFALVLNLDPYQLESKDQIVLKMEASDDLK